MSQPSGKFVIRMPGALHGRLKEEAGRTGRSLNQLCVAKLQAVEPAENGPGLSTAQACVIRPAFLEKIARQWQQDLAGMILFGSAARGDATEASDIDLLLVMKSHVKIVRALYRVWEELCRHHAGGQDVGRVSPHFAALPGSVRAAGGLWYEAALDGIVLWEREHQVSRFLGAVREAMGQGRIRRRILHGSPYWVKNF